MEGRHTELYRRGRAMLFLIAAGLGVMALELTTGSDNSADTPKARRYASSSLNDGTVTCDVDVVDTHGGESYMYVANPDSFTTKDIPFKFRLDKDPNVLNLVRATVGFPKSTNPSMMYLDVLRIKVHGDQVTTLGEINPFSYPPENTTPVRKFDLSGGAEVNGHVGHMDYNIAKKSGELMLTASCNDAFIDTFNRHMEAVYVANTTTTTVPAAVPPTLAHTP